MKKVVNSSMVAHLWAHQSQSEARNGTGSFYFDGDTIYSYGSHFPIARHVNGAVLFTTRSYSVTTAHHQSQARRAASHLTCYNVDDISDAEHSANFDGYQKTYEATMLSASRARSSAQWKLEQAESIRDEANAYARDFGLNRTIAECDMAEARERAKEQTRKAAKATQIANEKRKVAWDAELAELAEKLPAWRRGEAHLPHVSWDNPSRQRDAYLRIDGDKIKTSQGAEFPTSHATMAWAVVRRCRSTGNSWQTNGHSVHLGVFRLDSVDSEGNVRAGCHYVPFVECEYVARELGLE